ncbi:ciliary microtubule inner protein 4 isoform 2-T2 [Acridotheres tristis]
MELEPTAHRGMEHCSLATISTLQPSSHLHTWTSVGPACLYKPPATTPGIMDQKCEAQDNAELGTGQKGPNNCTEMTKSSLVWASLSDYQQLGYSLGINLFQGGPLRNRSLMRDSYTPDIFQKATIDPRHWHGKRIHDLGRRIFPLRRRDFSGES